MPRYPSRRPHPLLVSVLTGVGSFVGLAYNLLFGWWFDGCLAHRGDKRFGEDVRNNLVLLFKDHDARVIANDKSDYLAPRSFDYAVATVVTDDLWLRFVRVRGEFSIEISLPGVRAKWESVESALTWLEIRQGLPPAALPHWSCGLDCLDWPVIDDFLATNWQRLREAASAPGYEQ